jgi:hypothetical protein
MIESNRLNNGEPEPAAAAAAMQSNASTTGSMQQREGN